MDKIGDAQFHIMCTMWGVDNAVKAAKRVGMKPTQEQVEKEIRNEAEIQGRWNNVFKRKPKE